MRFTSIAVAFALAFVCAAQFPKDPVEAALKAAGKNRPEIQRVLDHYKSDPQKLDAARFLVANMIGKAYKVVSLADAKGKDVPFDALQYKSLDAALAAMDELEKQHGALSDKVTPTWDLEVLKGDFLIEQIDLAFEAWRTLPWAKAVTYETFRSYVLPYRDGKEPVENWRKPLMDRFADLARKLKDPTDTQEAAGLIGAEMDTLVGFWDLYYVHPTEQGYSEMMRSHKGRCGDLSNCATWFLRSNGIPCAVDYTPYWADTGNNHAWNVTLDKDGIGHGGVGKAAKIYRKVFENQRDHLIYDKRKGETLPPWLDRPDYVDVTKQYLPTTDVAARLERRTPHAYLCVFNDGEWRPIQWGRVARGSVTFEAMGRNILYLPATFGKKGVAGAAPPLILSEQGQVRPIVSSSALPVDITLSATSRGPAGYRLHDAKSYELYRWSDGWRSLGKQKAAGQPLTFAGVPSGGLYWLVEEGSRKEERPFTYDDGAQAFW